MDVYNLMAGSLQSQSVTGMATWIGRLREGEL